VYGAQERYLVDVNITKYVRTPAMAGTWIKWLFTVPNFLKHWVDFGEKTL